MCNLTKNQCLFYKHPRAQKREFRQRYKWLIRHLRTVFFASCEFLLFILLKSVVIQFLFSVVLSFYLKKNILILKIYFPPFVHLSYSLFCGAEGLNIIEMLSTIKTFTVPLNFSFLRYFFCASNSLILFSLFVFIFWLYYLFFCA